MDNNRLDFTTEQRLFRATVLKAKMIQYQVQLNRTGHKWLVYVNSTKTRYNFATWLVHSFYSNRPITAAILCVEIGVSRKAIDEIVNDWIAENWLFKEKGVGDDVNKNFLHPTDEVLLINDEWFQWYEENIVPDMQNAIDFYKQSKVSISDLAAKAEFNTTSTPNLSGIEDNVASFILESSRKRRKKENKI